MSAWFGDDEPLSKSFIPIPIEVVEHILSLQPAVWPRWAACLDLRRWQDRALGCGTPFPSRRQLAKRWGWTGDDDRPGDGAVRGLLKAEADWSDSRKQADWDRHPSSKAARKAKEALKKAKEKPAAKGHDDEADDHEDASDDVESPSPNPAAAQPEPSPNPNETGEPEKVERPEPNASPALAQPSPSPRHTRVVDHNTQHTTQSLSPLPPAARGAQDRLVEVVLQSLMALPPMRASKESGVRARLQRGDDRDMCKWLWDRLDAAGRLPTRVRAADLGDAGAVAVHRWVAERGWEPISDDAPELSPVRPAAVPRAPDAFLTAFVLAMREQIPPEDVDIWFRDARGRMEGTTLRLGLPDDAYVAWVSENYHEQTMDAARQCYGATAVEYEVEA